MRPRTRTIVRRKIEAARHLRLDSRPRLHDTCFDDPAELSSELELDEEVSTKLGKSSGSAA